MRRRAKFWLGQIFAVICLAGATFAAAQPRPDAQPVQSATGQEEAIRSAERGTVRVIAVYLNEDGSIADVSFGSGIVVAAERVVTNAHVVSVEGEVAQVLFVVPDRGSGGQRVRAEVLDGSQDFDLAILAAPGLVAPTLALSTSIPSKSRVVHALGYPGVTDAIRRLPIRDIVAPSQPYVTPGSIALISQTAPGGMEQPTIFHTAAINPGNSGGPLVDECGRVIGINTWNAAATLSDAGVSVPSGQSVASQVQTLLPLLRRAGVTAKVYEDACVPPLDPSVQARLDAADRAVQEAVLDRTTQYQIQLAAQRERRRLGEAGAISAVVLMTLAGLGFVMATRNVVFRTPQGPAFLVATALSAVLAAGIIAWLVSEFDKPLDRLEPPAARSLSQSLVNQPAQAGSEATLPSFDCSRAKSYSEKEICRDPALAARDVALGKMYAAALAHGSSEKLRAISRERWKERERCQDNACVVAWFDRRETELRRP